MSDGGAFVRPAKDTLNMTPNRSSFASRTPKAFALALLFGATLLGACSSSSNDSGGGGDVKADCHKLCDVQAQAANCPASTKSDSLCGTLCDAIVPAYSDTCKPKADAYYVCAQKLSYACAAGGNLPQPTDTAGCKAERDAYTAACQK
jgi:hypothetical protein